MIFVVMIKYNFLSVYELLLAIVRMFMGYCTIPTRWRKRYVFVVLYMRA